MLLLSIMFPVSVWKGLCDNGASFRFQLSIMFLVHVLKGLCDNSASFRFQLSIMFLVHVLKGLCDDSAPFLFQLSIMFLVHSHDNASYICSNRQQWSRSILSLSASWWLSWSLLHVLKCHFFNIPSIWHRIRVLLVQQRGNGIPPHVPCHFSGAYYTLVTWDHVLSPSKLASLRIVRTVRKQQFILKERREKKIKFDHFFHFRNLPSFRVLRTWDLWDTGGPHLGDNAVPQKLC